MALPCILSVSLAGGRGNDFADISTITIRNGVKGILGVALIQGGFIGLFMGAVILSLGFKLLQAWLKIKRKVVKLLGCFSRSLIVWIVGIVTILILSLLWIRSSTLNEVLLLE